MFTGCGGCNTGLLDAGFNVVMAKDMMGYARDVYRTNMPETDHLLGSVTDVRSLPKVDLLAGCNPCQGFSVGGVREAGRNINYLYRELDRALRQIKPKVFIVENVSGLRNSYNQHLAINQVTRFRMAS